MTRNRLGDAMSWIIHLVQIELIELARNGTALNLREELLENHPYGEVPVAWLTCIGWPTECPTMLI